MIIRNNIVRPKLMSDVFSRNMAKNEDTSPRVIDVNREIAKAEVGEKKQKEQYETPVEPSYSPSKDVPVENVIEAEKQYRSEKEPSPSYKQEEVSSESYLDEYSGKGSKTTQRKLKEIEDELNKPKPKREYNVETEKIETYNRGIINKGKSVIEKIKNLPQSVPEKYKEIKTEGFGNVIIGGAKSAIRAVESKAEKGVKYYIRETSPGHMEEVKNPITGKIEMKRQDEGGFSQSIRRFANYAQAERDRKAKAENLDLFYSAQNAQYREKIARSEAKSSQYGATVRRFGAPAAPARTSSFSIYNKPTPLGGVASSSPMGGGFQPNRGLVLSSGFSQTPGLRSSGLAPAPSVNQFGLMQRQEQQPIQRQQQQQETYGKRPYSKTGRYSKKNPDYIPRQQYRYEPIKDPNAEGGYYLKRVAKVPRI